MTATNLPPAIQPVAFDTMEELEEMEPCARHSQSPSLASCMLIAC